MLWVQQVGRVYWCSRVGITLLREGGADTLLTCALDLPLPLTLITATGLIGVSSPSNPKPSFKGTKSLGDNTSILGISTGGSMEIHLRIGNCELAKRGWGRIGEG
jgi:hypothetical protein